MREPDTLRGVSVIVRKPVRPLLLLPLIIALALGLASLVASPADAAPRAKTYTVTRTFGPFNGQATWQNGLPGQLPDGEALWAACDTNDAIRGHSMTIDRMGGRRVLRVLEQGVSFSRYEPDDRWMFYAFFAATGKPGWNKVRITVSCTDTAAPFRA
jgi:hypothetical protein